MRVNELLTFDPVAVFGPCGEYGRKDQKLRTTDSGHGQAHGDAPVVIVTSRSFICVHVNSLSSDTQCLSLGSKWILCFFDNPTLEWMPTNCFLVHSSSLGTTSGLVRQLMFSFQQSLCSVFSPLPVLAPEPDSPVLTLSLGWFGRHQSSHGERACRALGHSAN